MVKQINYKKHIMKDSRHIRWNYEESPDNSEMVRAHFIIVDDKNRKGIIHQILEPLVKLNYGMEKIRSVEGKVKGTKYRYLFESYDFRTDPSHIEWNKLGKHIKKDKDLYERVRGTIEDYVVNIYGDRKSTRLNSSHIPLSRMPSSA